MDKFRVIFSHGAGLLDLELLLVNSTMIHCLHLPHWTATFGGLFGASDLMGPGEVQTSLGSNWNVPPQRLQVMVCTAKSPGESPDPPLQHP